MPLSTRHRPGCGCEAVTARHDVLVDVRRRIFRPMTAGVTRVDRSSRTSWPLRLVTLGLTIVGLVAGIAGALIPGGLGPEGPIFAAVGVAFLGVGLLIVERSGATSVGWTSWLIGALVAGFAAADVYVRITPPLPSQQDVAWLISIIDGPFFLLIALLFLRIPDGHLPSPRWRILVAVMVILATATVIRSATTAGPLPYYPWITNPFGIAGVEGSVIASLPYGLLVGCVVIAALSLFVRWRKADAIERAQLKWIVAAAALVGIAMLGYGIEAGPGEYSQLGDIAIGVALLLFPIAVGIAILRYRLYEIDRLISRTISWAIVTATLAAVFVVVVVGLQALLATFTAANTLAVAASTLVVFGLFQPVRRRVQAAVDRRFDRAKVDAEQTVDALASRLRDDVDLEAVRAEIMDAVDGALHPAGSGLWLRVPDRPSEGAG